MVTKTFTYQSRKTRFLVEYEVTDEGVISIDDGQTRTVLEKVVRAKRNAVKLSKYVRVDELVLNTFRPNPAPYFYTCVDHINRDLTDDRLSNLRWSNATLRKFNMTENPGVRTQASSTGMRYLARVCFRGKDHCLGTFGTFDAARTAYSNQRDRLIKEYVFASTGIQPHTSLIPSLPVPVRNGLVGAVPAPLDNPQ